MTRNFFIILLLIVTSGCTKTTFVRSASNYSTPLTRSSIVLVLPPHVEVNQVDVLNKKTRVYNYEDRVEEIIVDIFITMMRDKGYNINSLSRAEISTNKMSNYVVDTKDEFNDLLKVLYANGAWAEEKAYSIDYKIPAAVEIGKKTGADLLCVINFYSESKTSAAITKDVTAEILKGVLFAVATGRTSSSNSEPAETSIAKFAIIDTSNGQVLWTHAVSFAVDVLSSTMNNFSDNDKVDRKKLSTLFNSALIALPSK